MPRIGRKESILAAARALFSAKGYHGTTIRDIAEESGMLSGSLYAHIKSKEDLLFEIMSQGGDDFLAAITPIAEGPGTASEKLRRAMAAHVQVIASSMETATIFMHEWKALDPERRAVIQAKRDRYEELLIGIIRQGVAAGEFRPDADEKFVRLLILSALNWLYAWYNPAGPLTPEAVAERFAELILAGIARTNPPQAPHEGGSPA